MKGKVNIKLQGHEKFALREGWINKALMILPDNSDAFTRKDATDLFGIGSNMVKSLRYWMRALGLTNAAGTELSKIGELIAKYDPYLEKHLVFGLCILILPKNKEILQQHGICFLIIVILVKMRKTEIETILF